MRRRRREGTYAGAELEGAADSDGGGDEDHPQGPSSARLLPLAPALGRLGLIVVPDLGFRILLLVAAAPEKRLRHLAARAAAAADHHPGLHILGDPHYPHWLRTDGSGTSHTQIS